MDELFKHHNFLIADPDMVSYESLSDLIGDDRIIREEKVTYRIVRSFNLDDIDSQVEESIYILSSKGKEEFDEEDIKSIRSLSIFSFDRQDMKVSHKKMTDTSFSVSFEKDINTYIISDISSDDSFLTLKMQIEMELGYQEKDDTIWELIDIFDSKGIKPWIASIEQIRYILSEIKKG